MDEISKSLVADYESSSSDEENELISNINPVSPTDRLAPALEMLNKPTEVISNSVFTNPYKEMENYEQSLLEKHVKMTTSQEHGIAQIRPCYKFYKGKCKLGDKCHFLHCDPVQNLEYSKDEEEPVKQSIKTKKRAGLKDDLIPPKKFMKSYKNSNQKI